MDVKHKTCDIRTWKKKHSFLDISSANIDTLVLSLYQCVEICNTEVFWLMCQQLPHLRFNIFVISETFATQLWTCLMRETLPTVNRKHFFVNILFIESFCPQKDAQQNAVLRYYIPRAPLPLWLLKPVSEYAYACLLPGLSWSWTVLLPSGTHRNPITSITAALLPFVTYLLTLAHTSVTVTGR
jgi:hypothetical protein